MCDTDWLLRRSRVVEPDQGAAVDSLAKNGKVPLQRLGIEGVRREVQLLRNIGFDACGLTHGRRFGRRDRARILDECERIQKVTLVARVQVICGLIVR